jgi:hypothetical protein
MEFEVSARDVSRNTPGAASAALTVPSCRGIVSSCPCAPHCPPQSSSVVRPSYLRPRCSARPVRSSAYHRRLRCPAWMNQVPLAQRATAGGREMRARTRTAVRSKRPHANAECRAAHGRATRWRRAWTDSDGRSWRDARPRASKVSVQANVGRVVGAAVQIRACRRAPIEASGRLGRCARQLAAAPACAVANVARG